ncbi:MAG: hypothetical protein WA130_10630 [Candidatus Methanoperedens sp.]
MDKVAIALTKNDIRVTAKEKNNPTLSISSKDSEKVVLKKVVKHATTSFINSLFK